MRLGLSVLVAVLACAVLAGPAAAAPSVPPGFLGVVADRAAVDGTVPLGPQMRRMRGDGAEAVGLAFSWAHTQPYRTMDDVPHRDRKHFTPMGPAQVPTNFREIDRLMLAAARAGLQVHPVVITAPHWARLHPSREFSPPRDPAEYASFAALLVGRYGPSGSFWAEHPDLRAQPIRDWQIWNEPVGGDGDATPSVFWADSEPFQTRYVALLKAAHGAIKAADPNARVVLGALVGLSWQTLQLIYDAGAGGAFDAVALHPYTGKPANVVRIVRNVREVMDRNGDADEPILITELGWPAFDAASVRRLGFKKAAATQAWWLETTFRRLIRQRAQFRLELVLWYTWIGRDRSRRDAFDHSGLLHLAKNGRLRAKPALRVFYSLAHGARR
jgi:hypothetical protein